MDTGDFSSTRYIHHSNDVILYHDKSQTLHTIDYSFVIPNYMGYIDLGKLKCTNKTVIVNLRKLQMRPKKYRQRDFFVNKKELLGYFETLFNIGTIHDNINDFVDSLITSK